MMNLRKSSLPPGWYPRDPSKIAAFLEAEKERSASASGSKSTIRAAAAPHAGWYYSGRIAARAVSALAESFPAVVGKNHPLTVAVIGGHLPAGAPVLFAEEAAVSTPLGSMEIDAELREAVEQSFREHGLPVADDRYADNTVEVLLPMVKYFFPDAKLLWLRLPNGPLSFEAGKILARASFERQLPVVGSTDLTHYGQNYGFSPLGGGEKALNWVKTLNDRRFIEAVESGNPEEVLHRAESEFSACSVGAVLGVMGYMSETRMLYGESVEADGKPKAHGGCAGKLIAYGTSADVSMDEGEAPPDSFVGYGAFVWE